MKILLTGKPRSGKTTLLYTLIEGISPRRGLGATEVREAGERIGFDLWDDSGRTAPLARTSKATEYPVGRYFVDIASFDAFIEPLFEYDPGQLLYIDEIGHMQLFSEKFQHLAKEYLESENDFIGTISYIYEHPFISDVRKREDILLCTVTPENRDGLREALCAALAHRKQFEELSGTQRNAGLRLAKKYLEDDNLISLRKLFNNAVLYVVEGRIKKVSDNEYRIRGNHDEHTVLANDSGYSCDCDLFNGRKQFEGKEGECSHIQAVKILSSRLFRII